MKNGSFEYSKSKYFEDNNKDIIYPNNKKWVVVFKNQQ